MSGPGLLGRYPLGDEQVAAFRRDGHLVMKGVAAAEDVTPFAPLVREQWSRHRLERRPLAERDSYGRAFTQALNLGQHDPRILGLSRSPRLARLAAALLGVPRLRVFLDEAFFKEPGAGPTPWHQDAMAWPFSVEQGVTLWIPLMPVTAELGLLSFATGSHRAGQLCADDIGDRADALLGAVIAERQLPTWTSPEMLPGDISAHHAWTIHRAGENRTSRPREVYAIHYFADGVACLADSPTRQRILGFLAPGLRPGDPADCPNWPLVYDAENDPT